MTANGRESQQPITDLGEVTDPLLVFGGPYGNLEATNALFAAAGRLGIPPERVVCTGDVVAYAADPLATVELVRESGIAVVMGNCEESLGGDADDCGCGFEEGSACNLLSVQWYAYAKAALDTDAKRWMASLPRQITFSMAGRRLAVVHGAASAINRFVFESTPGEEKLAEIAATGADGVICGHSGLPFTQVPEGRLWHNAGVIGLPANDGTSRVWYGLLRPERDGITVEHHPLRYDHTLAAAKMRARGLSDEYAGTLDTGVWHDCEVLPPEETARQGEILAPPPVTWRREDPVRAAS